MPEMRKNPITGEWVIIATERAQRPISSIFDDDMLHIGEAHDPNCVFCYGNEHATPAEVYCFRERPNSDNNSGWTLRIVTNKFSALNLDGNFAVDNNNLLKTTGYARGKAEVVIESPHHSLNTALFPEMQITLMLRSYKERYIELSKDKEIQYISIFKNNGSHAGATIAHPHSQIIATPVIPPVVLNELNGAKQYYQEHNRCVYCDMIEMELKDQSRIIYENDDFISFAPYASRTPFETWVAPKFHSSNYEQLTDSQLKSLTDIWKTVLFKIYKGLDNPPYNYYIHTSPTRENTQSYYHWHMELVPKMTMMAGFEMGTGMFINISIPEECAEYLRSVV